jgi:FAD-dependent urate hydroxylase
MNPVVVIGAGPYGLSTAVHLAARDLPVRIIGDPLSTWTRHMPRGMTLKSTPAASSIAAPGPGHTLQDFCREMGEEPLETERQVVPLDTFVRYGQWFQMRLLPDVESNHVDSVTRRNGVLHVTLDSGETIPARAVVVATGVPAFAHVPAELRTAAGVARDGLVSHSSQHADLSSFAGRDVVVVGAGQSALETAALLHESGAGARLLVRCPSIRYQQPPAPGPYWQPQTPLGRAWRLYALYRHTPFFRHLPARTRLLLATRVLGPAGAWWLQERVAGQFPAATGVRITAVREEAGKPVITAVTSEGGHEEIVADHVIAATGYRVDIDRLDFLSAELRGVLARTHGFPRLGTRFESSVPGLYFTGFAAAATFGPAMRFVCGTAVASPRLAAGVAA